MGVMTKQDIIREGMEFICEKGFGLDWNSSAYLIDFILEYQCSKGVVIKVETWLPARSGMTCTIEPLVEK